MVGTAHITSVKKNIRLLPTVTAPLNLCVIVVRGAGRPYTRRRRRPPAAALEIEGGLRSADGTFDAPCANGCGTNVYRAGWWKYRCVQASPALPSSRRLLPTN